MKKKELIFCTFCIFIFIFSFYNCNAQKNKQITDTLQMKKHDPKKASCLAIIPGAGQIYNKKYWKLPIVYGGLAVSGYLIYRFGTQTEMYRKEVVKRMNEEPEDTWNPKLSDKTLYDIQLYRDSNRKYLEISIGACAIVYFLSILDACVDAHLYYYDVSDNLSLGVKPKIDYCPVTKTTTSGMALVLKF